MNRQHEKTNQRYDEQAKNQPEFDNELD